MTAETSKTYVPRISILTGGPIHPNALDAHIRLLYRRGDRGPVEIVRPGQASQVLNIEAEYERIQRRTPKGKMRTRSKESAVLMPAPTHPLAPQEAAGTIRIRVEPLPGRSYPPYYRTLIDGRVMLPRTRAPIAGAVAILMLRGHCGILEVDRPGARIETVDMPTAVARMLAKKPIISRPRAERRTG